MSSTTKIAKVNANDVDVEVQSYIYQAILEFEPFMTPSTQVVVREKERAKSDKNHSIEIVLTDNEAKLVAEGKDRNIYKAIRSAKDQMLGLLGNIQDNVINSAERQNYISAMIKNGGYLH